MNPTRTRLPPFFSNLLPEGWMRNYLAKQASVKSEREFFLLWMLGQDLPGAIQAIPTKSINLSEKMNIKTSNKAIIDADKVLRFSLAGIQLKFSAIKKARGGLTIPSDGGRVHIEDFAQVFGVYPNKKYELASYRNIAQVIWTEMGETGIT